MQAHPLSSPAARIPSTSSPAHLPRASKAGIGAAPHISRTIPSPLSAGLSAEMPPGPARGLASELNSAFAMSRAYAAVAAQNGPASGAAAKNSLAEGAGLAHDAGNLLAALGLYCDLLQAPGVLRPEHQHYAVELRKLGQRSGALIERLLRANLPGPPESKSCDPSVVLGEQGPILNSMAARRCTVEVNVEPGLTLAPVPAETLERITLNLVRNAAQAMEKAHTHAVPGTPLKGMIRVSFRQVEQAVELHVEDDGPGLTPAMAGAFLRPAPLPAGVARGLGHRIVHELVQRSGGQMEVRVRPGRGTSFTMRWPADGPAASARDQAASGREQAASAGGRVRGGSSAC